MVPFVEYPPHPLRHLRPAIAQKDALPSSSSLDSIRVQDRLLSQFFLPHDPRYHSPSLRRTVAKEDSFSRLHDVPPPPCFRILKECIRKTPHCSSASVGSGGGDPVGHLRSWRRSLWRHGWVSLICKKKFRDKLKSYTVVSSLGLLRSTMKCMRAARGRALRWTWAKSCKT